VASSVLAALGELARVGGEDLTDYLDKLMPLIIDALQDQSSTTKRDAALKTLGQLASNTGFVIEPYQKYPQLLNILINILKTESSVSIRRETVKLIGILGALDPYRHKVKWFRIFCFVIHPSRLILISFLIDKYWPLG